MVMSGITCQLITGAGRALGAGGASGGAGREGGREAGRDGWREREGEGEKEGGGDFPAFFKGTIYIQRAPHQPGAPHAPKCVFHPCFPPGEGRKKITKIIIIIILVLICEGGCCRSPAAAQPARPARGRGGSDGKSPTYLTRLGQYFGWGLGMSAGN